MGASSHSQVHVGVLFELCSHRRCQALCARAELYLQDRICTDLSLQVLRIAEPGLRSSQESSPMPMAAMAAPRGRGAGGSGEDTTPVRISVEPVLVSAAVEVTFYIDS